MLNRQLLGGISGIIQQSYLTEKFLYYLIKSLYLGSDGD